MVLKNRSNKIRSNQIRIRRELPVLCDCPKGSKLNYTYLIVAYRATVYKTGTRAISTSCTLTHGSIQVIKDNLIVPLTSFSLKFSLHLILR